MGRSRYCVSCPLGHACANAAVEPTPCVPGTYQANEGQVQNCQACPAGTLATRYGQATCDICPAGHGCDDLKTAIQCSPGTASLPGEASCRPCVGGTIALYAGATACLGCPRGHSCQDPDDAVPCASGTYSLGNMTNCTACPPGYSCPSAGAAPAKCGDGGYSLSGWQ